MDWEAAKQAMQGGERVRATRWLPGVSISQEKGSIVEHREGLAPRITGSHLDDDPFLAELDYELA
jgi:hypothetical protein